MSLCGGDNYPCWEGNHCAQTLRCETRDGGALCVPLGE
jgi:hypothetical protein